MEWCNPLFLVKDFNSKEFTISNEFMTNADTPTLAVDNLIRNPINPFTGRVVNNDEKKCPSANCYFIRSLGYNKI